MHNQLEHGFWSTPGNKNGLQRILLLFLRHWIMWKHLAFPLREPLVSGPGWAAGIPFGVLSD